MVYQLTVDNCTGGCNPGPPGTSMGTVTITDTVANTVTVQISLVAPLQFVNTGLQETVDFNLAGNPSITLTPNGSWALASSTAGTNHFDGFGDFEYAITTGTSQGAGGALASPVTFTLTGAGLDSSDFEANANGFHIGVDVYNPTTGRTGPIGDGGGTVTPEPISLLSLGISALGLGLIVRKRSFRA
ncbi:MAG TPA: PEP-CTERM sorting domain-containing protein [Terriglobia bacterium]|nr:PEP-CTERM sorting domain-containing protein [Terriglobia bacterium]